MSPEQAKGKPLDNRLEKISLKAMEKDPEKFSLRVVCPNPRASASEED